MLSYDNLGCGFYCNLHISRTFLFHRSVLSLVHRRPLTWRWENHFPENKKSAGDTGTHRNVYRIPRRSSVFFRRQILPDAQYMLHQQADRRNAYPAAESHGNRFAAGFYQLHNVRIQADSRHGKNDEELAHVLQEGKHTLRHTIGRRSLSEDRVYHRGNHGSQYEVQDEHRENLFQIHLFAALLLLLPSRPNESQRQGNRNDGQRSGQFDRYRRIQRLRSQAPHTVPGGGRRRHGGSIVYRRPGEDAEGLPCIVGKSQHRAQHRKQQRRDHVEKEDNRNRLGHFLVIRIDNRRGGRDGGTAADGGSHAYQCGDPPGNMHQSVQHIGDDQRCGDRADDDRQRLPSRLQNDREIHAESQQNNRPLEDLL